MIWAPSSGANSASVRKTAFISADLGVSSAARFLDLGGLNAVD